MFRRACLIGTLAVLVIAQPLWAQNDDKDKPTQEKPATPAEQFRKLTQEFNKAQQDYFTGVRQAKTDEERQEAYKKAPKQAEFADRALKIAQEDPDDAVAVDSLLWIVRTVGYTNQAAKAVGILSEKHVENPKVSQAVLTFASIPSAEKLIRTVREKSSSRETQGMATYALAQNLRTQSTMASRTGNEQQAEKLSDQADALLEETLNKFGDVKYANRTLSDVAIQSLTQGNASDKMLRKLLERDLANDVRGKISLGLAQAVKDRADQAARAKDAEKEAELLAEAETLFEQVIEKFGGVEYSRRKTPDGEDEITYFRDIVKPQLFEMRNLVVGKEVPEIEGDDTDGETFKLSDYRGKVVMIDFWGHW